MNFNLESAARILGRSAIIGLVIVSVWYAGYMGGLVCGIHGKWFGLDEHECSLLSYGGMGILKMLVLTFFVFPWMAIKLELIRQKRKKI